MVRNLIGTRVQLVHPYVSCMLPGGGKPYGKRLLHKKGAVGTITRHSKGSVNVQWDEPYRWQTNSGYRRMKRFEYWCAPW